MRTWIFELACGLLLPVTQSTCQSFTYTPIDVPCTACPNGKALATTAYGINPAGDVVGTYTDTTGRHGFLRKDGQFKTIDVPASLVGGSLATALPTSANGISPDGDIVGNFTAPVNSTPADPSLYCPFAGSTYCIKGFLYRRGEFSLVLFPGHLGAIAQRITANGDIHGCLHDYDMMGTMYGFGITHFGATSLQENGGELTDTTQSVPASMENGATLDGRIRVGNYADLSTGFSNGYIVEDGVFHTFDISGPLQTNIWDINPAGDFVGIYIDIVGHRHGFMQQADWSTPITNWSAPIEVDYPNAVHTRAYGINPARAIVGQYVDAHGAHGFLATPND
jgi:probable HAF family extracellular repeat protein